MRLLKVLLVLIVLSAVFFISGCADENDDATVTTDTDNGGTTGSAYAGSSACSTCHSTIYDDFMNSGHPYKLNKVAGAQAPEYPYSELADPPEGYTWADITYVIGGYGWKARFIDTEGYIITGDAVQYNIDTGDWVSYHATDPVGTKQYDCGKCHTTGWEDVAEGENGQDDLPGMAGTFEFAGIQCEACHGAAKAHVDAGGGEGVSIVVDDSAALCGACHTRDSQNRVEASGGLIRHHEQYDELLASPHSGKKCVECHDPHKTVKYDSSSIRKECGVDCHTSKTINSTHLDADAGPHKCITCHMAKIVKSARTTQDATGNAPALGDIRSHLFKINASAAAEQFYTEDDKDFSNGYITLEYVCLPCHTDKDVDWAAENASGIH